MSASKVWEPVGDEGATYFKTSFPMFQGTTGLTVAVAALFHGNRQVTHDIPSYIREVKHTPDMRQYLIRRSKEATGRDEPWDEMTYDLIDWRDHGEAFKKLSIGHGTQISTTQKTY
jgi:hypothetical protein